ncbi:hypothetical protein THAOC_03231, partial [Thalassiosira oceanica]
MGTDEARWMVDGGRLMGAPDHSMESEDPRTNGDETHQTWRRVAKKKKESLRCHAAAHQAADTIAASQWRQTTDRDRGTSSSRRSKRSVVESGKRRFALDFIVWLLAVVLLFLLAVDSAARVITLVEHAYISLAYDAVVIIVQAMDNTVRVLAWRAQALAWGYIQCVPSPPLLVVMHTFSTLATKALSLLLEVKDWIHATAALFIEAKDVLVGLVSRSTTALRHQARSALFAFLLKGGHNDLLLHMDSQDLKSWLRDNNDGVAANEDDPTS